MTNQTTAPGTKPAIDIAAAFDPLYNTLARLRLLTLLTGDNVCLMAAEEQDLHEWMREMSTQAFDQATAVEQVVSSIERGAQ